jgi:hypothetical protein
MAVRMQCLCSVLMVTLLGCAVHEVPPASPPPQTAVKVEESQSESVATFLGIKLPPYGRAMVLTPHTPWSPHCTPDTQSEASRRYIPPGI